MTETSIQIRGARQNNLTGVDLTLPRNRLVAVTGVSGSGKSSLAFDTLFREGQRRFLETLSAYARQFLGRMEKPDVEHVEGLSPAIAVDQKSVQRGPRSTVGTLTEVTDHLRVLFARAGTARCPDHGVPLRTQTVEAVVDQIRADLDGERIHVLAPLVRDRKGQHKALFADLGRKGYVRARVDGEVYRLEEVPELDRYKRHRIELVVDRLAIDAAEPTRLREAVAAAVELGEGDVIVQVLSRGSDRAFSTQRACSVCGIEAPLLEPRLFSFNSPHGACPTCDGLGNLRRPTEARVVRDPALSIREGALAVMRASGGALNFPKVSFEFLEEVGERRGLRPRHPLARPRQARAAPGARGHRRRALPRPRQLERRALQGLGRVAPALPRRDAGPGARLAPRPAEEAGREVPRRHALPRLQGFAPLALRRRGRPRRSELPGADRTADRRATGAPWPGSSSPSARRASPRTSCSRSTAAWASCCASASAT